MSVTILGKCYLFCYYDRGSQLLFGVIVVFFRQPLYGGLSAEW